MKPSVADVIAPHRVKVSAAAMTVWAAALRDPNPIHLDPAAVRAAGLGDRVINQGPANVGYMLNGLAEAMPDSRLLEFEVRFLDVVRADDILVAEGRVVDLIDDEEAICSLTLTREDGRQVLSGTARIKSIENPPE